MQTLVLEPQNKTCREVAAIFAPLSFAFGDFDKAKAKSTDEATLDALSSLRSELNVLALVVEDCLELRLEMLSTYRQGAAWSPFEDADIAARFLAMAALCQVNVELLGTINKNTGAVSLPKIAKATKAAKAEWNRLENVLRAARVWWDNGGMAEVNL